VAATAAPAPARKPDNGTVFSAEPRRAKSAAAPADIPWSKIAGVAIAVIVIAGGLYFFHGSSSTKSTPATTETAPVGSAIDTELAVREALGKVAALRGEGIDIRVKDGTVTLIGTATSSAKVEQALRAAKALPGVKSVVNKVQIRAGEGLDAAPHAYSTGSLR